MTARLLYLARHGAAEGGRGHYVGHTDLPLSADGEVQAARMGRRLADRPLSAIYCSDLQRSRQTAEIASGSRTVPIVPRPDLREIAMGAWEGLAHSAVAEAFPNEYRARGESLDHHRPPGGESFAQCRERACRAVSAILAQTVGDLLLVGHAGLNRTLLCHWLGMATADLFRLGQDPGCLNIIRLKQSSAQVQLMNFPAMSGLVSAI